MKNAQRVFGEERRDELTRRIDARTFLSRSGAPIREKIGKEKARGRGGGEEEWLGSRGGRAEKKLTVIGVKAFLTRLA